MDAQIFTPVRDWDTIAITGDVDLVTAPIWRTRLADAINRNLGVVADLSAVTFMDASGLAALLHADRHARSLGRLFQLAALPPNVAMLLRITRLDSHFASLPGDPVPPSLARLG